MELAFFSIILVFHIVILLYNPSLLCSAEKLQSDLDAKKIFSVFDEILQLSQFNML